MTADALSYTERLARDRRRLILRILNANGGSASETTIEQTLVELGERIGVDRGYVREQLRALEDADCVTISKYRDTLMVAEISAHGAVVLEGRLRNDVVAPRKLGEPIDLGG